MKIHPKRSQIKLLIFLGCLFYSAAAPLDKTQIERHFGGKIIQHFGDPNFTNPKIRTKRIFVALNVGTEIRSLGGGMVEHAGWLEGFSAGLTVKIKVSDERFLVYSCLSGLSVEAGQQVKLGQKIGLSAGGGDTCGLSPGLAIFFLDKGQFKDPLLY